MHGNNIRSRPVCVLAQADKSQQQFPRVSNSEIGLFTAERFTLAYTMHVDGYDYDHDSDYDHVYGNGNDYVNDGIEAEEIVHVHSGAVHVSVHDAR